MKYEVQYIYVAVLKYHATLKTKHFPKALHADIYVNMSKPPKYTKTRLYLPATMTLRAEYRS